MINLLPTRLATRVVRGDVDLDGHGAEELPTSGPLLLVANHGSELDELVVRASLSRAVRRRLRLASGADDAAAQLRAGRVVLYFPEGDPSPDGLVHGFDPQLGELAELAEQSGAVVVPVGIRGSYAARPPGRSWTGAGRPRVSVRFGAPLAWRTPKKPVPGDERGHLAYAVEARRRVETLIEEDATSWWTAVKTGAGTGPEQSAAPAATWRRIWSQAAEASVGGGSPRAGIWRR